VLNLLLTITYIFFAGHAQEYFVGLEADISDLDARIIEKICSEKVANESSPEGIKIKSFVTKYRDLNNRIADQEGYKEELNHIFSSSKWAHIHACGESLNQVEGQSFNVEFIPLDEQVQAMRFEVKDLNMSIKLSILADPVMTLTTFTHEMLHACQYNKKHELNLQQDTLWSRISEEDRTEISRLFESDVKDFNEPIYPNSPEAKAFYEAYKAYKRNEILDEIDGMFMMNLFYFDTVSKSSSFCGTEDNPSYYKSMLAAREAFKNRSFPIFISHVYQPAYNIPKSYLFDLNSAYTAHPQIPFLIPEGFSEQALNSDMIKELSNRGY